MLQHSLLILSHHKFLLSIIILAFFGDKYLLTVLSIFSDLTQKRSKTTLLKIREVHKSYILRRNLHSEH
jgi:hypothetical protein